MATPPAEAKKFDLNIEKVLEDWGPAEALRELIANALDEQALTKTPPVTITKDKTGNWHVQDDGRGLQHEHLTQNENKEKLAKPDLFIGKFGVGLKDALATFDRKKITVHITSRHETITLGKAAKHGFADITTLHALITPPANPKQIGTDVQLVGITDADVAHAKAFFLTFSNDTLLETTGYGHVLAKRDTSKIYITGLRVAEEPNFLFSYNITATTKAIRKALNRERTNVGRTAYADRIKSILLACTSTEVGGLLVEDLKQFQRGTLHDELQWLDVAVHACKLLNATERVLFLTPAQLFAAKSMAERAQSDGYTIITIPENVQAKLRGATDLAGTPLRDLAEYTREWNTSFSFTFVNEKDLTNAERAIFAKTKALFALIGGQPKNVKHVLVSETMRLDPGTHEETVGVFELAEQRIVIKRSQLKQLQSYACTLLHEAAHARSNADHYSQEFEDELSALLGLIAAKKL
jgi:hypothetical protein